MSENHPDAEPTSALARLLAADRATRRAAAGVDRWLEPYRHAARDALSEPELDSLLRDALDAIAKVLGADAVSILLANDNGSELIARAAIGLSHEVEFELRIPADSSVSGRVLATGLPRIVGDLDGEDVMSDTLRLSGLHSFVGVPLQGAERVLGVLHATSQQLNRFGDADAEVLDLFAGPIASAIERVGLFESERSARLEAERAADRLRGLQRITASLASAATVEDVCKLVLNEAAPGLADVGGERGIWMLRNGRLLLVAGGALSADYTEIPPDPSLPAAENLRTGEPLFVESREEIASRWPILAGGPTASFAGLPLIVDGRRLGVMALGFYTEHTFAPDERIYITTIAEQAATALARAESSAALLEARQIADQRREQLDFLARASERLAQSLELDVTMQTIAELAVPYLADRCALFLMEEGGITTKLLAPDPDDDERQLLEELEPRLTEMSGVGAVVRTGVAEFVPLVNDAMLVAGARSEEELELLRRVGFGGLLILPLRARRRNLGALAFVNRRGRTMSTIDQTLAAELTARAAIAIDNALLYLREADVARRLAATLLPSRLPVIHGLDIAARYVAGSAGLDVGGDFYDLYSIAPDSWLLAVGDVQGRGVEAAAVTGFVRHTLKSAALSETSPAALLQHLNEALIRSIVDGAADPAHPWNDARLCTAVLVRLDHGRDGWSATVSSAGHPAPLLRQPDNSVGVLARSGLLLGVKEGTRYEESRTKLQAGACVVCFTDGVSDRPIGDDRVFGSEGITEVLRSTAGPAQRITDAIVDAALRHESTEDDIAVLTVRVVDDFLKQ